MNSAKEKLDNVLEHLSHAWNDGGFQEFAKNPDVWPPEVPFGLMQHGARASCAYHIAAVIESLKIWHDQEPSNDE